MSWRRIQAIVRKELREYRRNRSLVATMAIFPLIFLIQPIVILLTVPATSASELARFHFLLYMLGVPVLVPATLAATAVAGERQQGSLEPMLTTPIRRDELVVGKALAVLAPSVVIAYAVYAVFLVIAVPRAQPQVASAIVRAPDVIVQLLATPLLALLTTWVGIAISTRVSDLRVAQQLSLLGVLPVLLVTSLIAFDVIHATLGLGLGLGLLLVVVDGLGWRLVSSLFDRERLITGTR
jgi:ABC-2 type transport system permease protein